MNVIFIIFQYIVPQHLLSRMAGKVADCEWPWLKNLLITRFIKQYEVNMDEAAEPEPSNYKSFNAFFTRELKSGARQIIDGEDTIASPADGAVSQIGDIEQGRIFQAKGQHYTVLELLAGNKELSDQFKDGKFATIYLSPKDYHRVHMPMDGDLTSMSYVPGDLFSVNTTTAENVPRLFSRNERAVCIFETDSGPMAVVLVGAMIVAGIETVWDGQVAPLKREIKTTTYNQQSEKITLKKGGELGRFKLGSTAIILFGPDAIEWEDQLDALSPTRMGELLATKAKK